MITLNALEFYFKKLPQFSDKLKDILQKISKNKHTKFYQAIGDNIRSSGKALKDNFLPENIFTIAYRTNKIIKMLRSRDKENNNGVFVVIDTIRNPFEATFFKDRYSSFYMIAINVEDHHRIHCLQKTLDCTLSEIKEIDKKEYEDKPKGEKLFTAILYKL